VDHKAGCCHATDDRADGRRLDAADARETDVVGAGEERSACVDPVTGAALDGVGGAAADAGGAGLDAPADRLVPADERAVRVGLRALAADLVEAEACSLVGGLGRRTELHELAVLEVTATRAVVVDGLTEDELRTTLRVELLQDGSVGQLTGEQHVDQDGDDPLRVNRTRRQVDDRNGDAFLLRPRADASGACGVRGACDPATIDRARADRDDRGGLGGDGLELLDAGLAADAKDVTVLALHDGALDDEDESALLDGRGDVLLRLRAGGGHDRLPVVDGEKVENDGRNVGRVDLGH